MMLRWCADSLAAFSLLKHSVVHAMAKAPAPFGWMTWPAREASRISTIADTVDGETMIALTVEMLVCSAFQSV